MICVRISEQVVKKELGLIDALLKTACNDQEKKVELQHSWFRIFAMERLIAETMDELAAVDERDPIEDTHYVRIALQLANALQGVEQQMDRLLKKDTNIGEF